jgi:hypothetical protein
MQTEDVIQDYNNALDLFRSSDVYHNPVEGVTIHKITAAQAAAISTRIKPAAAQYELPLSYALACLAIESTFDPECENANIGVNAAGVARSNPTNDPLGYDMGIAQLKLRYLIGSVADADSVVDAASAKAFAFSVDRAIPYFCSLMADKIMWATNVIERDTSSAPDVRLRNPLLLATGSYNFGETGMLEYFENGTFPSHCQHVVNLSRYFSSKLGVADIFANLPEPQ